MRSSPRPIRATSRSATAITTNDQLRRFGYGDLVGALTEKHPLRADITPTRARDSLLVLTGPQLFVQFTRDLGWSSDDLATWITHAVLEMLFGVTSAC